MFLLLGSRRPALGAFILLCLRLFCMSVHVCERHYVHLCARPTAGLSGYAIVCARAFRSCPPPPPPNIPEAAPAPCTPFPARPLPHLPKVLPPTPLPLPPPHFYFSPALPLLRASSPFPPLPPAAPPLALFTHDTLNQDEKKLMQLMHLLSHCLPHPRRWISG